MSNASRSLATSDEHERVGPDYFGYYSWEVKNLLSEDKDFLPSETSKPPQGRHRERREKTIQHSDNCSGSLYCNVIGPDLSDSRKERLRLLLRQGAFALSSEVDEMLEPALAAYYLQSRLRSKRHSSPHIVASSNDHAVQAPCKKFKGSEDNCTDSESRDMALSDKGIINVEKSCSQKSEGKELPNCKTDALKLMGNDFQLGYKIDLEKENGEVNDDLHFLLENDGVEVEEVVKKHSDELYGQLEYMEQQLESLLDAVMSKCRPMTLSEKQQLQKQLQMLPPRNLDRVAELICRSKAGDKQSCDDIFVDLEKEDNTTLWRLYYYAEAVEKAKSIAYSREV